MPGTTLSSVPHITRPPSTNEILDYADLPIIDLAKAHTAEGRAELAIQLRDAMTGQGFFYAINHGYTQAQNDRIFDVADVPFSQVDDEEKTVFAGDFKTTGIYQGYKSRGKWHINAGVPDEIEHYNINRDVMKQQHPEALQPLLPEIEDFAKFCHMNVLHPILRLFAIGLELPEETFVNIHGFSSAGESSVRFMKYYPRSADIEARTDNVWLKGHTDTGSITILWSQPISALQILLLDGKWRWVRHIDNALVINAGDAMEFLSGGFYKATIHRVIQPPVDQRGYARVGVFYFAKADDNVKLVPYAKSPVLQKYGMTRLCEDDIAPTMEMWRKGRASAYGLSQLKKREDGNEEEVIRGVVVKHYN
ncbi:hypothetical protein AcW1_002811 [Taiwanofungus camphoratus]|nr:hypothetical protein AcV5_009515 [Antrodia cinnamomea]KAI0943718.1 hypothetical protein AcW1_002811 [Antrodia cinnamomea]